MPSKLLSSTLSQTIYDHPLQCGSAITLLGNVMGVRQWDATSSWPLPACAGIAEDGAGLIVPCLFAQRMAQLVRVVIILSFVG